MAMIDNTKESIKMAYEREEKIWVDGYRCSKRDFANGGSVIKIKIEIEAHIAWLRAQATQAGVVCLQLGSGKSSGKPYMELDQYAQKREQDEEAQFAEQQQCQQASQAPEPEQYNQATTNATGAPAIQYQEMPKQGAEVEVPDFSKELDDDLPF